VILLAILIIVCGALAASGYIIKRKPDAQQLLNKIAPYQGILGACLALWSIWSLIDGLRFLLGDAGKAVRALADMGLASTGKITFAVWMEIITGGIGIALGFLLAYGLISKYALSQNAAAAERGAAVQAKLVGIQIPLGAAGIVCGVLLFIARIIL
jgi:hypothetical protein